MKCLLFILALCWVTITGAQVQEEVWSQLLSNRSVNQLARDDAEMTRLYEKSNDSDRVKLLDLFTKNATNNDPYLAARSLVWRGMTLARKPFLNFPAAFDAMQQGINKAIESGEDYLIVQCIDNYALNCHTLGQPETALFYFLKSAELRKKLPLDTLPKRNTGMYCTIGDLLFQMQEYRQAIPYLHMGTAQQDYGQRYFTSALNTLALAYQKEKQYDSASHWFKQALKSANTITDTIWAAIVKGNMGALFVETGEYQLALPLLWKDHYTCRIAEPNSADNTLQRIAFVYLAQQKIDSALLLCRKAYLGLSTRVIKNGSYTRNASQTLSKIFKQLGNMDSALYYADIYHQLNDSISRAIARNRADVAMAKLDFEKTTNKIQLLQQEKAAEKLRRNLLLAALILLLASGWFYFRWQKQQHATRQQKLLHNQQMAEAETANARKQLEEYTLHIIEKNQLIEGMQQQLQQQNIQLNEDLLNQTILTENDWLRFKIMFEKAQPGFITFLQKAAPGITTAEIRLATLIRLNLGNKHIAAMLGIGADAVRKTKSRLRQRLQITGETDLENYLLQIPQSQF